MSRRLTKLLSFFLSLSLIFEQPVFAQAAQAMDISGYLSQARNAVVPQDKFRPLHLRYISYDSQANDFKLLLDKGDYFKSQVTGHKSQVKEEDVLKETTQELMRYFFIGLTLPNDKFWVNLRPDSPQDIIDDDLAKTDIGRIFLEADVQLKKDTAGFTSPQTPEGKEYWDKLYQKAGELFGMVGNGRDRSLQIPTLTRPWIVPNEVIIRESPEGAYIYKATLKVMLEEDYLKSSQPLAVSYQQYNFKDQRLKELNEYSTQLIRETIIPKLTDQVNTAKRYAPLRQVYYSLILAQWFKARFGEPVSQSAGERVSGLAGKPVNSLTGQPANPYIKLIDSRNLTNLTTKEPYDKQTYFKQYQKSFQEGEYNLSEQVYTSRGQSIRKYVSGGILADNVMRNASPVFSSSAIESSGILRKALATVIISATMTGLLGTPVITKVSKAEEVIKEIHEDNAKIRELRTRIEGAQDEGRLKDVLKELEGTVESIKRVTLEYRMPPNEYSDVNFLWDGLDKLFTVCKQRDVPIPAMVSNMVVDLAFKLSEGPSGTFSQVNTQKTIMQIFSLYYNQVGFKGRFQELMRSKDVSLSQKEAIIFRCFSFVKKRGPDSLGEVVKGNLELLKAILIDKRGNILTNIGELHLPLHLKLYFGAWFDYYSNNQEDELINKSDIKAGKIIYEANDNPFYGKKIKSSGYYELAKDFIAQEAEKKYDAAMEDINYKDMVLTIALFNIFKNDTTVDAGLDDRLFKRLKPISSYVLKSLQQGQVKKDYNNADAEFIFGGQFYVKYSVKTCLVIKAHEITHRLIPIGDIYYDDSLDEFLADFGAFRFAMKHLNEPQSVIKEYTQYVVEESSFDKAFKKAIEKEGVVNEKHLAARAQMEAILRAVMMKNMKNKLEVEDAPWNEEAVETAMTAAFEIMAEGQTYSLYELAVKILYKKGYLKNDKMPTPGVNKLKKIYPVFIPPGVSSSLVFEPLQQAFISSLSVEQLINSFKEVQQREDEYEEAYARKKKIVDELGKRARRGDEEAMRALVECGKVSQGITTTNPAIVALAEMIEDDTAVSRILELGYLHINDLLVSVVRNGNADVIYEAIFHLAAKLILNPGTRREFGANVLEQFEGILKQTKDGDDTRNAIRDAMELIIKGINFEEDSGVIPKVISLCKEIGPEQFTEILSRIVYYHYKCLAAEHINEMQDGAFLRDLNPEQKRQLFNMVIEPLFFINRDISMRKALWDIAIKDFSDIPEYKYFLYYCYAYGIAGISQEEISAQFPAHAAYRGMLTQADKPLWQKVFSGKNRVLIMLNTLDGIGDEWIRKGFISALKEFNPGLEITVYTRTARNFIYYDSPGVKLQDISGFTIKGREKFDLVIHYSPSLGNEDFEKYYYPSVERELHRYLGENKESAYIHINRDLRGVWFSDIFRIKEESVDLPAYREGNNYIFHYRLFAELGLPLPKTASGYAWDSRNIDDDMKDAWKEIVYRNLGNKPIAVFNGFAASANKGFQEVDRDSFRKALEGMVRAGAFVIILPAQNKNIADEFLRGLDNEILKSVFLAPQPDGSPLLYNYLLLQAKAVVTVEGGIMHIGSAMGKPVVVFTFSGSGNLRNWFPVRGNIEKVLDGEEEKDFLRIEEIIRGIIGSETNAEIVAASAIIDSGKGGIDFHGLPINISTALTANSLASAAGRQPLTSVELDAEWAQIQALFNAGIRPSTQRLIEFSASAISSPVESRRIEDILGLIAEQLRREEEEETLIPADSTLKGLLIALESSKV